MSKYGSLQRIGAHPSASSVQHASPMPLVDAVREVPAEVAPAVGSLEEGVTHVRNTYVETAPERVLERTEQVTALINRHVPIPWMHGDQKPVRG